MKKGMLRFSLMFFMILSITIDLYSTEKNYIIDIVIGDVEVLKAANENWEYVGVGDVLVESDSLKTGDDSYCDVIMSGRGIFRIEANTEIVISSLSDSEEKVTVERGTFLANIVNLFSDSDDSVETFEVETSTAVVAVRGTQFDVSVDDNEDMTVQVQDGTISARPNVDLSVIEDETVVMNIESELETDVSSLESFSFSLEEKVAMEEEIFNKIDQFLVDIDEDIDEFISEADSRWDEFFEEADEKFDEMMEEAEESFQNIVSTVGDKVYEYLDEEAITGIIDGVLDEIDLDVDNLNRTEKNDLENSFADLSDEEVELRIMARLSGDDNEVEVEPEENRNNRDNRRDSRNRRR